MSRVTNQATNTVTIPSLKGGTIIVGVGSEGALNGGNVGTLTLDLQLLVGANVELRLYQYARPGAPRSPIGINPVYQIARGGEVCTLQFLELSGYAVEIHAEQESGNPFAVPIYWTVEAVDA